MTNYEIESKLSTTKDDALVTDLALIIENDGDIYRSSIAPTLNSLRRKHARGTFDSLQAVRAFFNVVDSALAAPAFRRWYTYSKATVPVAQRYHVAAELLNFFSDELAA